MQETLSKTMIKQRLVILLLTYLIYSCSNSESQSKRTTLSVDSSLNIKTEDLSQTIDQGCVFDTSIYKFTTQALKKYKSNLKYTWDDTEKEAKTVLENGDTLTLHIGGCDHFSYSATLITSISFDDTKALTEKSKWLAKTFFDNGFDSKYDTCISQGHFKQIESYDKEELRAYKIIDTDTTITNMIYEGFQFWKLENRTKIVISAYLN
jgi:hypothetical protein